MMPITREKKPNESKERTQTLKPGMQIFVHMKIDEKREWNFQARGATDAVKQGMEICEQNNLRFPYDVREWEFIRGDRS